MLPCPPSGSRAWAECRCRTPCQPAWADRATFDALIDELEIETRREYEEADPIHPTLRDHVFSIIDDADGLPVPYGRHCTISVQMWGDISLCYCGDSQWRLWVELEPADGGDAGLPFYPPYMWRSTEVDSRSGSVVIKYNDWELPDDIDRLRAHIDWHLSSRPAQENKP